jgi:hypothetical protein
LLSRANSTAATNPDPAVAVVALPPTAPAMQRAPPVRPPYWDRHPSRQQLTPFGRPRMLVLSALERGEIALNPGRHGSRPGLQSVSGRKQHQLAQTVRQHRQCLAARIAAAIIAFASPTRFTSPAWLADWQAAKGNHRHRSGTGPDSCKATILPGGICMPARPFPVRRRAHKRAKTRGRREPAMGHRIRQRSRRSSPPPSAPVPATTESLQGNRRAQPSAQGHQADQQHKGKRQAGEGGGDHTRSPRDRRSGTKMSSRSASTISDVKRSGISSKATQGRGLATANAPACGTRDHSTTQAAGLAAVDAGCAP